MRRRSGYLACELTKKIYVSGGLFLTYEGYVKVTGAFKGILEGGGYGLVEISPPTG